jgi:hypothetical protein
MIILQHLLNKINTTIYNKLLSFTPDKNQKNIIKLFHMYIIIFFKLNKKTNDKNTDNLF